jgi:23S rRNA-intervening sequence protein
MPDAFAPGPSQPDAVPLYSGATLLDAEKLDCYRVAVEFQWLVAQLVPKRGQSNLRDQLDRASLSIVLNTAEGAGRVSAADKARFYAMARGSALNPRPSWIYCGLAASSIRSCGTAHDRCWFGSFRC